MPQRLPHSCHSLPCPLSRLPQDYAAVALLAIICSLLETLVGKDGMLNDSIPDFALLHALQWVSWAGRRLLLWIC